MFLGQEQILLKLSASTGMPINADMRDFVANEVDLAAEEVGIVMRGFDDSLDPLLTSVEHVQFLLYEISTSLGSRLYKSMANGDLPTSDDFLLVAGITVRTVVLFAYAGYRLYQYFSGSEVDIEDDLQIITDIIAKSED